MRKPSSFDEGFFLLLLEYLGQWMSSGGTGVAVVNPSSLAQPIGIADVHLVRDAGAGSRGRVVERIRRFALNKL